MIKSFMERETRHLGLFGVRQKRGFAAPYGLGGFATRRPTENPLELKSEFSPLSPQNKKLHSKNE